MPEPRGIAVPFRFDITGYPAHAAGESVLHCSIFTILSTVPGERVMRPGFGSYLRTFIQEPMSRATGFRCRAEVFRAIRLWEPRVRVVDVLFELNDTTIILHVTWRANGSSLQVTSLAEPRTGG